MNTTALPHRVSLPPTPRPFQGVGDPPLGRTPELGVRSQTKLPLKLHGGLLPG